MKFRPCIDIHNGKVKQLVGGSLQDEGDRAKENFVSQKDSAYYANLYKKDGLKGGHIILLNSVDSQHYDATREQALDALESYRGGMQIGGGIHEKNAAFYLRQGASHVIVTSFVFKDGRVDYDNLNRIFKVTGKDHLVLDLSCRKKENQYFITTDRWQKMTNIAITYEVLDELSQYCDEFLIHGVDVEGKVSGIEEELVEFLGKWNGIRMTYAGGISSFEDIDKLYQLGNGRLDFTIGSALDIFGGHMPYKEVVEYCKKFN